MIEIDPKDWRLALAFIVLVFIAPLALVSYGRHQGWEMHQRCLIEVSRDMTAQEAGAHCSELR